MGEESRIAELEAALQEAQRKLEDQSKELERVTEDCREAQQRLKDTETEMENHKLRAEVERLKAVERVRDEERERSTLWAEDLRERCRSEKRVLEDKVASLEATLASKATPTSGAGLTGTPTSTSSSTASVTSPTTTTPSTSITTSATVSASSGTHSASGTTSAPAVSGTSTSTSTASSGSSTSTTDTATTVMSTGSTEMLKRLFETQSQLFAAQMQAASLPPLSMFDGQSEEDNELDLWLERFEARANLAKWTDETKLCQLQLHLSKVAGQAFQMLPKEEKSTYARAVVSLKKRFRSVEIEELKGLEFHRRVQGEETVEKLGMDIQKLGRKAFPTTGGKELDRLLKGRFYQALHPKWQRKLNAPRTDETFEQLFERARTLEQHEKQFTASAAVRNESQSKKRPAAPNNRPATNQKSPKAPEVAPSSTHTPVKGLCRDCGQAGHWARNCPKRKDKKQHEAPGRSGSEGTRTNAVEAKEKSELTEEELELLLAKCRLQKEQQMMIDATKKEVACIEVTKKQDATPAVGPSFCLNLSIEGVPVASMVDCGSPTTIISRSLLHRIVRQMHNDGKALPELSIPMLRLFGKDGHHEIKITARVELQLQSGGKSVTVPLFVQPDSSQDCLLGTNACLPLGLQFLDGKGKPLEVLSGSKPDSEPVEVEAKPLIARVSLVQACTVPSRKCKLLPAHVSGEHHSPGEQFLFEPEGSRLPSLGLSSLNSLVTLHEGGKVFVPVQNFGTTSVEVPCGLELGTVEPFNEHDVQEDVSHPSCARVVVSGPGYASNERSSQLLQLLDLSKCDCSPAQLDDLRVLLAEHSHVFGLDKSDLGHTNIVQHVIDTGSSGPIKQQPYRTPVVQREHITQLIKQMQVQGIVKPSASPWASPVVLVPKKDGSMRFCVDYRRLNTVTKKDVYPLPRIDDILDTLAQAKYFTTLDLSAGYWQVELDKDSQAKTAFTTHCGLFEFTRMPFGLCNAPATFQRLMQLVLSGLEWDCCFVYIDDILVASKTFEDHLRHLQLVFERLRKAGLRLKPTKCHFIRDKVPYLGFLISKRGIQPDPLKTDKVNNFPRPTSLTSLRSFLGLASYYRRFVPHFATVAAPLHRLTKKDTPFEWNQDCETAFSQLKSLLTQAPVLVYPQFGQGCSFQLETDASGVGLGAILSQKQDDGKYHPVAYASRSLLPSERNYPISELETLAIVWAVKYFRTYLLGHPCVVLTDHASCLSLLNTSRPSAKLARWAMAIQEMNLEIRHRSGRSNAGADALSRSPVDATATVNAVVSGPKAPADRPQEEDLAIGDDCSNLSSLTLSEATQQKLRELSALQKSCEELKPMFLYLADGILPDDEKVARRIILESRHFDLLDGVLHHENPQSPGTWCTAVPTTLRADLLEDAHSGLLAGHLGERRVYDRLRRGYWWQGMRRDVRKHCRACLTCATRRGTSRASHPPLQSIPVGGPFHCVGVDILKLPLTCDGNQYVLVFLDYLTKWVEAFPIKDQKAETVARVLVEEVICRHGAPERLLSDRGANFLSELIAEVCRLMRIKKLNTSGYHPQTDGLVERFHRTLISMLSMYVEKHARDWDRFLPFMLYAYRVTAQESTKESPFYLLYGRDARQPLEEALDCPRPEYLVDLDDYKTELVRALSSAWKTASECIESAQKRQKTAYDRHAKAVDYRVGDRVMVHMPHEATGKAAKLARPFFGPYRIVNVTSTNAEVRLVDKPDDPTIFVSLDRVRPCYSELPDSSWSGHCPAKRKKRKSPTQPTATTEQTDSLSTDYTGPITRSRAQNH